MPSGWLKRVPQHQLVEHLEAEVGLEVRLAAAVERDRHVEALDLGPERVVRGVVPRPAVDRRRREEDRLEAELLDAAARLDAPRRRRRAARPCRRRTCASARSSQKSFIQSLYARAIAVANSGSRPSGPTCSARVEPEHEQAARRVEHGHVEALGVHRRDLRRGVPARGLGVGVDVVVLLAPAGLAARRRAAAARCPRRSIDVVLHLARACRAGSRDRPRGAACAYAGSM